MSYLCTILLQCHLYQFNLTSSSWPFQYLSSLRTKLFTDSAFTTVVSGKLFQIFVAQLEKNTKLVLHTTLWRRLHSLCFVFCIYFLTVVGIATFRSRSICWDSASEQPTIVLCFLPPGLAFPLRRAVWNGFLKACHRLSFRCLSLWAYSA